MPSTHEKPTQPASPPLVANPAVLPVSPLLGSRQIVDDMVIHVGKVRNLKPEKVVQRPASELFNCAELDWICLDHVHKLVPRFSPLEQFFGEYLYMSITPQAARVEYPLLALNGVPLTDRMYFGLPREIMQQFRGWLNSTGVMDKGVELGRIICGAVGPSEKDTLRVIGGAHIRNVFFAFYVQTGYELATYPMIEPKIPNITFKKVGAK